MDYFQTLFNRLFLTGLTVAIYLLIGGLPVAAEARVVTSASVVAEQPMNFVLVQDTTCATGIACPRWIAGEGSIHPDTPEQLQAILARLDGEAVPLLLNSRGGDYEAAMRLGSIVAMQKLTVVVAATGYPNCTEIYLLCRQVEARAMISQGRVVTGKAHCDFACVFVVAASQVRSVPKGLAMEMPVLSADAVDGTRGFVVMTANPTPSYVAHLRLYARAYGAPRPDGLSITLPMPDTVRGTETQVAEPGGGETQSASPAAKPASSSAGQLVAAASVGTGKPMDFVVLQMARCAGQTGCPSWISAEGIIDTQTPKAFRSFLAKIPVRGMVLMINSRGGDYEAAMELGRIARDRHLKIGLGRTVYPGCGAGPDCRRLAAKKRHSPGQVMENGVRCDLACVFFLAGGEERRMPQDSHLTMPKIKLGEAGIEGAALSGIVVKTASPTSPIEKQVRAFLDEMGMYKALFVYGVSTRLTTLEPIDPSESSLSNLVSNRQPPSRLLVPEVSVAPAPVVQTPPKVYVPKKTVSSDMRFYVVTTPSYECSGECKSWIAGIGEITAKSPASLRKVLKSIGKRRLPVILHSQGGSVEAAMEIGRMIRQRQLSVSLGMTSIDRCGGAIGDCAATLPKGAVLQGRVLAAGAYCLSACPLIFAGGVERVSSDYSFLGVHQITTVTQIYKIKYMTSYRVKNGKRTDVRRREVGRSFQRTDKTTAMTKAFRKRLLNYLAEMGVDGVLLDRMKEASPEEMRMLTTSEALSLHVMTKEGSALELIAAQ